MRNELSFMNPSIKDDKHLSDSGLADSRILWAAIIAIVLSVIGLSWYAYSFMTGTGAMLTQIPSLQQLANTMGDRLNAVDGKMAEWATDRTALTDSIAKVEKTAAENLKTARTQAESVANAVGQRVRQEMVENLQRIQARLGNVESTQHETADHVSQLQAELTSVRQQMASMQEQNAQRLSEVQAAAEADVNRLNDQMSTMRGQVTTHADKLQALNNEVGRERTTFALSANQTRQVASGIYVTVSHTDVAHQKVDGWMQLADEGRIVWIRGLAAQEALTFATRSDNRTHELVFTAIQPTGVSGYLLLPTANSQSSMITSK
jgi:predicted  nucleic acid-binding Zn-ribbon protein